MIRPVEWRSGAVVLLDQRLLPMQEVYRVYRDHRDVARAIHDTHAARAERRRDLIRTETSAGRQSQWWRSEPIIDSRPTATEPLIPIRTFPRQLTGR